MPEPIPGYKTYAVAAAMIGYAALGIYLNHMDQETAGQLILEACGLIALRLGIKKVEF